MKVILIIFLLLVSIKAIAPPYTPLYITKAEAIDPYKAIKYAVGMVECNLDILAFNLLESATGYFQVRPIRLNDYNERTGSNYTLQDMYDYEKAERVFMYYATRIGYRNPGQIARDWNGSGPMTWEYWRKVRYYLII